MVKSINGTADKYCFNKSNVKKEREKILFMMNTYENRTKGKCSSICVYFLGFRKQHFSVISSLVSRLNNDSVISSLVSKLSMI